MSRKPEETPPKEIVITPFETMIRVGVSPAEDGTVVTYLHRKTQPYTPPAWMRSLERIRKGEEANKRRKG